MASARFPARVKEGDIAILSTSGGMANELMAAVSRAGEGIRLAIATGGGRAVGTDLREAVAIAEADPEVRRLVVRGAGAADPAPMGDRPVAVQAARPVLFRRRARCVAARLPYGHTGAVR